MVAYCLENKSGALTMEELSEEVLSLAGQEAYYHPEILFRRVPIQAFSMPREALWSLIYFHQGRNKTTGLYFSRRTLQTASGKPFRIGESVRLLERRGFLQRHSAVGWKVLQEDPVSGRKYPAFRASALQLFLENPSKARWIALRFILSLAQLGNRKPSYRAIQQELACGSDLARHLVTLAKAHAEGILAPSRLQNRLFNWSKEKLIKRPYLEGREVTYQETNPSPGAALIPDQEGALVAPNPDITTQEKAPGTAENRTESGPQYKALNKEKKKKNPSTRPAARSNPGEGLSRRIKKIPLQSLGFRTTENLVAIPGSPAVEMEEHRQDLGSPDHYEAAEALYNQARTRAQFREEDPARLARYVVDAWLETVRRKETFRTSALGYFFTTLRNNLAAGYCRLDLKRQALERKRQMENAQARYQIIGQLSDLMDAIRRRVLARCEELNPAYYTLASTGKMDLKLAVYDLAVGELRNRGELTPLEIALLEYCEEKGSHRESLGQFLDLYPTLIRDNAAARSRLKEAA